MQEKSVQPLRSFWAFLCFEALFVDHWPLTMMVAFITFNVL